MTDSTPQADQQRWLLLFGAWLIATISTLGALFFSEVMSVPPCVLCWYQRIFMFPLVLLLPLALFPLDPKVVRYALPMSLLGLLVAGAHWLLQLGIIPASAMPCSADVPCTEDVIEWFGFLSIPLMSVLAFAGISILLFASHLQGKK
ncbi:disulfide bond formation protein B [Chitinibacter bivalviorum]|uniref:Disulfide bond formation protein B n=1 Tax=Chitinibacter bivalviorum TaxID=2739434 RepID=A0A7H9BMP8_9NEIS|nr:disulfide bond formation protein B [Chitinibacter bivalviorum]